MGGEKSPQFFRNGGLAQMSADDFGQFKHGDLAFAKKTSEFGIGQNVSPVFGILQFVLFDIIPKFFDGLSPRDGLGTDDVGQSRTWSQRTNESRVDLPLLFGLLLGFPPSGFLAGGLLLGRLLPSHLLTGGLLPGGFLPGGLPAGSLLSGGLLSSGLLLAGLLSSGLLPGHLLSSGPSFWSPSFGWPSF